MDFSIIQRADISPAELGFLVGVTRAQAYRWVIGTAVPGVHTRERASRVLAAINSALNDNDLPMKLGTPRADRKRLLEYIVRSHEA